jgi:hypothetical protein
VRHRKVQKTTSLADSVRAVIAIYPEAIFEWPDGTCSISEFPKGPEISRRYRGPLRAWFDAAHQIAQRNLRTTSRMKSDHPRMRRRPRQAEIL